MSLVAPFESFKEKNPHKLTEKKNHKKSFYIWWKATAQNELLGTLAPAYFLSVGLY